MLTRLSARAGEQAEARRWWILGVLAFSLLILVVDNSRSSFVDGFHASFWVAAGVAAIAGLSALLWLPARARTRPADGVVGRGGVAPDDVTHPAGEDVSR